MIRVIKILGLFGQITFKNFTLLHVVTRNKIKDIRNAYFGIFRSQSMAENINLHIFLSFFVQNANLLLLYKGSFMQLNNN
jgi:hypothetical protein